MGTPQPSPIPLTVIGGYLGAGKTTLLNSVIRNAAGRRLGIVVNDFGELSIDADLLAGAIGSDDGSLISLPNGCVCCTLGHDLHLALQSMLGSTPAPEQIVIEVSGVADPAVTAAWGSVPPFEPGGVIVLADAEQVRARADDRYVGGEVRRQLAGADLVVVTKADLVTDDVLATTERWLERAAPRIPRTVAAFGALPVEVVLGHRPEQVRAAAHPHDASGEHGGDYVGWSWTSATPIRHDHVRRFVDALPRSVLRMKGSVMLDDGELATLDVVGARRRVAFGEPGGTPAPIASRLVAVGPRAALDPMVLDELARTMVGS